MRSKIDTGNRYTNEEKQRAAIEAHRRLKRGDSVVWSAVARKYHIGSPTSVATWYWESGLGRDLDLDKVNVLVPPEIREEILLSKIKKEIGVTNPSGHPYEISDQVRKLLAAYEHAREEYDTCQLLMEATAKDLSKADEALRSAVEAL